MTSTAWRCMLKPCIDVKGKSQHNPATMDFCTRCWEPKGKHQLPENQFISLYQQGLIAGQSPYEGKGKGETAWNKGKGKGKGETAWGKGKGKSVAKGKGKGKDKGPSYSITAWNKDQDKD